MRISDRFLSLFKGKFIAFVVAVFIFCTTSTATADGETKGFVWREWREYRNSFQLLEGSGVVSSVGVALEAYSCIRRHLVENMQGEFFSGRVNYDGQTWGGNPVQTDISCSGFKVEGNIGRCLEAGLSFFGSVIVSPGRRTSAFAEVILRHGWFKVGSSYEGMRFLESPAVSVSRGISVYQPELEADIFGFSAGVRF